MHTSLIRAAHTAQRAFSVAKVLKEQHEGIAPKQAEQLATFLSAFAERLKLTIPESGKNEEIGKALALEFEVDRALRFVESVFLDPRRGGNQQRVLATADWLCGEGFSPLGWEGGGRAGGAIGCCGGKPIASHLESRSGLADPITFYAFSGGVS